MEKVYTEKELQKFLSLAINIASEAHLKILDKGDKAYILHPLRIMFKVAYDPILMMIAVLHDVIEDSDYTIQDLRELGFPERVLDALSLLTHDDEVLYDEYIKLISKNIDAIIIKLEDLKDNSNITRLKGLRQKDLDRTEKYHKSFTFLVGELYSLDPKLHAIHHL